MVFLFSVKLHKRITYIHFCIFQIQRGIHLLFCLRVISVCLNVYTAYDGFYLSSRDDLVTVQCAHYHTLYVDICEHGDDDDDDDRVGDSNEGLCREEWKNGWRKQVSLCNSFFLSVIRSRLHYVRVCVSDVCLCTCLYVFVFEQQHKWNLNWMKVVETLEYVFLYCLCSKHLWCNIHLTNRQNNKQNAGNIFLLLFRLFLFICLISVIFIFQLYV